MPLEASLDPDAEEGHSPSSRILAAQHVSARSPARGADAERQRSSRIRLLLGHLPVPRGAREIWGLYDIVKHVSPAAPPFGHQPAGISL